MKFYSLAFHATSKLFSLHPFSGSLLGRQVAVYSHPSGSQEEVAEKVRHALELCNNPYRLAPSVAYPVESRAEIGLIDEGQLATRMVRLCRTNFFLARWYAGFRSPTFDCASVAIQHFRNSVVGEQKTLCLPRALFAAKTSRRFSDEGVVFIGAFLPSRSMHAWVIEGGRQPDPLDFQWTNFRPVAAIG